MKVLLRKNIFVGVVLIIFLLKLLHQNILAIFVILNGQNICFECADFGHV